MQLVNAKTRSQGVISFRCPRCAPGIHKNWIYIILIPDDSCYQVPCAELSTISSTPEGPSPHGERERAELTVPEKRSNAPLQLQGPEGKPGPQRGGDRPSGRCVGRAEGQVIGGDILLCYCEELKGISKKVGTWQHGAVKQRQLFKA